VHVLAILEKFYMRNTKSSKKIVGIGEILWDLLPQGKQLGGAPANFAYQANALGAEGLVVSAIGNDPLGHAILEELNAKGMSTIYIAPLDGLETGTVSVTLDAHGVPQYTIHEEVAWDNMPTSPALLALANDIDAVCYGSLAQRSATTRDTIQDFLNATHESCLRICDINLRQAQISIDTVTPLLDAASMLKLNDEELPVLQNLFNLKGNTKEQLKQLQDKFELNLIALTKGAEGSLLVSTQDHFEFTPHQTIELVDTVGAGDAFTAALVVGVLEGLSLQQISKKANDLAAFVCTQPGAMPDH
jgi:fructokinase